jgi:hypothetical protein
MSLGPIQGAARGVQASHHDPRHAHAAAQFRHSIDAPAAHRPRGRCIASVFLSYSVCERERERERERNTQTHTQVAALQSYTGPKEELGTAERFLFELLCIPRLKSRLQCFVFILEFNARLHDLSENVEVVSYALHDIKRQQILKSPEYRTFKQ